MPISADLLLLYPAVCTSQRVLQVAQCSRTCFSANSLKRLQAQLSTHAVGLFYAYCITSPLLLLTLIPATLVIIPVSFLKNIIPLSVPAVYMAWSESLQCKSETENHFIASSHLGRLFMAVLTPESGICALICACVLL